MLKFLIIGENSINKEELVDMLLINEGLFTVAKYFTTNTSNLSKYQQNISYIDLNICYKNNAVLFINTQKNVSIGITLDEFYENNLIFMNTEDFNNISNKTFMSNNDLVIIWLDTKKHDPDRIKIEVNESKYLLEKIEELHLPYMYFLDCDNIEIMDVIVEYLKNEEKRSEIIANYS